MRILLCSRSRSLSFLFSCLAVCVHLFPFGVSDGRTRNHFRTHNCAAPRLLLTFCRSFHSRFELKLSNSPKSDCPQSAANTHTFADKRCAIKNKRRKKKRETLCNTPLPQHDPKNCALCIVGCCRQRCVLLHISFIRVHTIKTNQTQQQRWEKRERAPA